jgi:hypothetical protein
MKRFYQTEWQGIRFASFADLSASRLADADFYNAFYDELFRRYGGYNELSAAWRREKGDLAEWIAGRLPAGSRVLSVGAGLGYMEYCLHRDHGQDMELHVQDYASNALTWLRQELPAARIHLAAKGSQTECRLFDLIYLSAVDYAVEDGALITLLADMKTQLCEGGACLLISASLQDESLSLPRRINDWCKEMAKRVLETVGMYHRGQFWGWLRTQSDYRELMRRAHYHHVTDGFIQTRNLRMYFIEGRVRAA